MRSPPPEVLHLLCTFGFGGAEVVAADLLRRARARGERASAMLPGGGAAEAGLRAALASEPGAISAVPVADPDEPGRRAALRFALAARRATRAASAAVVHAHLPAPDRLSTALLARGRRPAVLTFHALPRVLRPFREDLLFGRAPLPWLLAASTRIAPVVLAALTEVDAARLRALFPGADVRVVPNAPSPAPPPSVEPLPFDSDFAAPGHVRLIGVGRLDRDKAFDRLLGLLAAPEVRALPWSAGVVGDGPERGALEAAANELGLAARVRFLGRRPAGPLLGRAELFVTTSLSEGLPLSLLEAMAAGLAVVASPIPAHREVLEGIPFALLPERNSDWPAHLARLLGSAALRGENALAAKNRVEARYTPERQDAGYAAIYRELGDASESPAA